MKRTGGEGLPILAALAVLAGAGRAAAEDPLPLPGTQLLDWQGDLSARIVEGIDRFLRRELTGCVAARARHWQRDFSSRAAYEASVAPNRERLRKRIGAVDPRLSPASLELLATTGASAIVATSDRYLIRAVRWPVLDGVHGEGLLLEPHEEPAARIVFLPDADGSPEAAAGLAPESAATAAAARLAAAGALVVVPALIGRSDAASGNEALGMFTNQPHREWVYRQAFEMGRHPIGYEVAKVLALVDWFEKEAGTDSAIGVAGYGEGGLIALHAAALDPRIDAALVSGYFDARERLFEEPIYRNVFGLLEEFGDAELASLIYPRSLVVEHAPAPAVDGPPPARDRRSGAAQGRIRTPAAASVEAEVARALALCSPGGAAPAHAVLITGANGEVTGPGSEAALRAFLDRLGAAASLDPLPALEGAPALVDGQARERRQLAEMVAHVQRLLRLSEHVRRGFWKEAEPRSAEFWTAATAPYKQRLWEEVIGRFPPPSLPASPRTRRVIERPAWTAYEVVLDVWPEVFAWGWLLVPRGIAPGERRPAVVCQHGLEGVPADTVTDEPSSQAFRVYQAFTARLAEMGFVTYAPHNPYRGGDRFRVLQRLANPLGKSLFSVIIGQHQRTLEWLGSLSFVDPSRIGFYGLSYGGKTAVRVPPLLDGYALSICSADYNEWIKKNVTVDDRYSYVFTGEYEMPEFDLGHTFNYAELAALVAPRPFMVERGHHDGVAPDEWVAYEYAKVRRLYAALGIPERTEIEFFDGPHAIHGKGTFEFLKKHLRWPVAGAAAAGAPAPVAASPARRTEVAIRGDAFLLNGRPTYAGRTWKGLKVEGLLINARLVQATFDDLNPETRGRWAYPDTGRWDPERNTREFIAAMPEWRRHGLLAFTLNLQGGNPKPYSPGQPWHNAAIAEDGSLRADYLSRLERILDRADELGMAVILGIFYFGQDQRLKDEAAVRRALDGAVDWVLDRGWRNVLIEVNNECDIQYDHALLREDRVHELIARVQARQRGGRRLLAGASLGGGRVPREDLVRIADFILIHGNGVGDPERLAAMVRETRRVAGYTPKPILFNEDDHFDFEKPRNNFTAAVGEHASWGYFDPGESNYRDGHQSPPVEWGINTERKRAFFALVREMTGGEAP
jgi:dienelactone hydrolase